MAKVVVTLKIMPDSPDADLQFIESEVKKKIISFTGKTETKTEIEPIAFGLKALKILFVMDESKGATDSLEKNISTIKGIQSVEAVDVRRTIG